MGEQLSGRGHMRYQAVGHFEENVGQGRDADDQRPPYRAQGAAEGVILNAEGVGGAGHVVEGDQAGVDAVHEVDAQVLGLRAQQLHCRAVALYRVLYLPQRIENVLEDVLDRDSAAADAGEGLSGVEPDAVEGLGDVVRAFQQPDLELLHRIGDLVRAQDAAGLA